MTTMIANLHRYDICYTKDFKTESCNSKYYTKCLNICRTHVLLIPILMVTLCKISRLRLSHLLKRVCFFSLTLILLASSIIKDSFMASHCGEAAKQK